MRKETPIDDTNGEEHPLNNGGQNERYAIRHGLFLSLSMLLGASSVWAAESTIKPVQNIGAWFIGFHADKENPSRQWVAHHFVISFVRISCNVCSMTTTPRPQK